MYPTPTVSPMVINSGGGGNTGVIIAIIFFFLLLLIGGGVAWYYLYYKKSLAPSPEEKEEEDEKDEKKYAPSPAPAPAPAPEEKDVNSICKRIYNKNPNYLPSQNSHLFDFNDIVYWNVNNCDFRLSSHICKKHSDKKENGNATFWKYLRCEYNKDVNEPLQINGVDNKEKCKDIVNRTGLKIGLPWEQFLQPTAEIRNTFRQLKCDTDYKEEMCKIMPEVGVWEWKTKNCSSITQDNNNKVDTTNMSDNKKKCLQIWKQNGYLIPGIEQVLSSGMALIDAKTKFVGSNEEKNFWYENCENSSDPPCVDSDCKPSNFKEGISKEICKYYKDTYGIKLKQGPTLPEKPPTNIGESTIENGWMNTYVYGMNNNDKYGTANNNNEIIQSWNYLMCDGELSDYKYVANKDSTGDLINMKKYYTERERFILPNSSNDIAKNIRFYKNVCSQLGSSCLGFNSNGIMKSNVTTQTDNTYGNTSSNVKAGLYIKT